MIENRLKEFREKAGLSQTELARHSCVSSQNISHIECGRMAVWPRAKKSLAKALKVKAEEIFPGE
jgi:transcriptional regulator with XRE-family HTH domain